MSALTFTVRGLPVPQGSARAFVTNGRAVVTTGAQSLSSPLGAWRAAVAGEARDAVGWQAPLSGPLAVDLAFRLPRPKNHWLPANGRRRTPELRLDAPVWHSGRPDIDKLTRACLDALTGVVVTDDSQVSRLSVTKRYASPDEWPGVVVTVSPLELTA